MKKSIFLAIATLFFGVASFAQQPTSPENKAPEMPTAEQIAQRRADRLQKQLLLGKDQYKKVYKLCLEQAEQDVARMKQHKAEKEKMSNAMKGILNDAQYERFEQMQSSPRNYRFHQHNCKPQHAQRPRFGSPENCPYTNRCRQQALDQQPDTRANDNSTENSPKFKIEKGKRIRMVEDPHRNQNAYNYIEGNE